MKSNALNRKPPPPMVAPSDSDPALESSEDSDPVPDNFMGVVDVPDHDGSTSETQLYNRQK